MRRYNPTPGLLQMHLKVALEMGPGHVPNDPDVTLKKLQGSPYEAPLREAIQRGAHSYATTYYMLAQQPGFRKAVGMDE